jgi:hypothetical protein
MEVSDDCWPTPAPENMVELRDATRTLMAETEQATGCPVVVTADANNPDQQYQLQSMPGKFSGLQMMCIMYVGFKRVAPECAASFDLSNEYAVALEMFKKRRA